MPASSWNGRQFTRILFVLSVLLVLLGLTSCAPKPAQSVKELPPDLIQLLPGTITAFLAAASVTEFDTDLHAMLTDVIDAPADSFGIAVMLHERWPGLDEYVDLSRSMAIAVALSPPMSESPANFTFILPLRNTGTEAAELAELTGMASSVKQGGYVALSTDPDYEPGSEPSPLAADLPDAAMAVRADLAEAIAQYRPFLEMMLQMALAEHTQPGAPGSQLDQGQYLTAEAIAALQEVIGAIVDSIELLEVTASPREDYFEMTKRVTIGNDSPLDLGPQPSFARALDLAHYLEPDSPIAGVSALNAKALKENFPAFTAFILRSSTAEMPEDLAEKYQAWLEQALTIYEIFDQPLAYAGEYTPEGMKATIVMESPEPAEDLERILDLYRGLEQMEMGFSLEHLETRQIGGVEVQLHEMDMDMSAMANSMIEPGPEREEALAEMAEAQKFIDEMIPQIWIASVGKLLVMCTDDSDLAITRTLEAIQQGTGEIPHRITDALAWAGDDVHYLGHIEYGNILSTVMEMLPEEETQDTDWSQSEPAPVIYAGSVTPTEMTMALKIDLGSWARMIKHMETMEKDHEEGHTP